MPAAAGAAVDYLLTGYDCCCAIATKTVNLAKLDLDWHRNWHNSTNFPNFFRQILWGIRIKYSSCNLLVFVREHGVHAGPKDYFVVVVVVVIRGSI
jgi:hypothetical protein